MKSQIKFVPTGFVDLFIKALILLLMIFFALSANAQKPVIGILNLDGRGVLPDDESLGSMARTAMERSGRFDVLDWYDVREALNRSGISIDSCFGRSCVVEAGKMMHADKMLLGNVVRSGEKIMITLKLADVASGNVEHSSSIEYRNQQQDLPLMMEISVKKLIGESPDQRAMDLLVAKNEMPDGHYTKVNLSGPRAGLFYTAGEAGERMRADEVPYGGYGMYSVSTLIGWQQEVAYLSSGNFQALFEFLFTGAGLESGRFIPALSIMNGFRINNLGWEIAFGPTFRVVRMADGYYELDEDGNYDPVTDWHLEEEWDLSNGINPYPIVRNLDDRGKPVVSTGLLIAVGKTFSSGGLNIPVNLYCIPRKTGVTYGIATGFNMFKSKKNK